MNRLYSNYQPPKLTKLALGGYESFSPTKVETPTAKKGPSTPTPIDYSAIGKRIIRPLVKNPIVQKIIDPKYDGAVAAVQAGTIAGSLIPGTQAVTVPLAAATNTMGAIRGGTQMLNNWVDDKYDTSKNPGGTTRLVADTTSNVINALPAGKLLKGTANVVEPAVTAAVDMIKRPITMAAETIGNTMADSQDKAQPTAAPVQSTNTQAQPTAAPVQSTNTQAQTQSPTQTVKTNSYVPRYIPPKNYYKLAEQEQYQIQADYDPAFNIMQPGDNYTNFIRNNVKAQLEMGRRRGAFAGTILGAIGGGIAGHKLLEDNETLGKYSPYAAGAAGALLGAGIGNLAGRPVGMLSSVSDIPYTVVQSMPIMQDAYRKLTQPVFPDYVDPNTYI